MRILVVEDELDMRQVLEATLREAGYAVDSAADGEEGYFKAMSWEYDAIVLDLMLPKMNGFEFLERLRKQRASPVLILTARDQIDDRVRGLDLGADDYLVKPFELLELLARVRAIIRRAAGKSKSILEIGDVTINTATRTVEKSGQEVALTAKEYSLLEFLAVRRGELVSRTMLYEHLYDENEDSLSNLVDVYISNVRRKVGREMITTRRGHGYIIEAEEERT
jgi:two-component system OmpR family response regulator